VRAARRVAEQFERRTVTKTYWALVEGTPAGEVGSWHDHLRKVPGEARAEVVDASHADARKALLHYRLRGVQEGRSWLEIELETGRTHQIRIQAASRGHPVVGDALYGSRFAFGPERDHARDRWIGLHARRLAFRHPMTREPVDITAPLPDHWPNWIE
jgi:23S rRNA-/tRNA-specific pseudouridylate synthase